jgi:hypothetical protein
MPHDKHGRLIEAGDFIKVNPLNQAGGKVIGRVVNVVESQACTGRVAFPVMGGQELDYFYASDAELVLKHDGAEPEAIAPAEAPPQEAAQA